MLIFCGNWQFAVTITSIEFEQVVFGWKQELCDQRGVRWVYLIRNICLRNKLGASTTTRYCKMLSLAGRMIKVSVPAISLTRLELKSPNSIPIHEYGIEGLS